MLITIPPPDGRSQEKLGIAFLKKCIFLIIAVSLVNERGVMVHLFYITLIKD